MPFDYDEYQKKCNTLTTEQLHKEWENYTRQISGGATSTATSVIFSPLTGGISLVGLGLSAPRIHNARKKREIIEAGLQARGTTHNTRKRDVIAPMAIAGTLGGVTLGLAGPGADMIAGAAVGHGIEYATAHVALDATGAVLEQSHDEHSKKKADEKLQVQYQNFQRQHIQEQMKLQESRVQPGLQSAPSALQNLHTVIPQTVPVNPSNILKNPDPKIQMVLQIPPPIPSHSRPGTPQQDQPLQNQQQLPDQASKYNTVPVPPAYNHSYQPASHSYQFSQASAIAPSQVSQYQSMPQPEKYDVTINSLGDDLGTRNYFPEKTAAYVEITSYTSPIALSPSQISLPQYSGSQVASTLQKNIEEFPGISAATNTAHSHPQHIDLPPASATMDEEIMLLKARLLQLELEKREACPIQQPPPSAMDIERTGSQSSPSLVLIPPSTLRTQEHSYYSPPPASPALPPRSPVVVAQQLPPDQSQQYFPPPPPSPRPQSRIYALAPASYTYNPQSYPHSSPSPNLHQQEQQPLYQRHDSGYYSDASTPAASKRLSMSFIPGQATHSISSQSIGHHSQNASIISLNHLTPMSPAPPPYYPPPPSVGNGPDKIYFQQYAAPVSQNSGPSHKTHRQSQYGTQGWQWGAPGVSVGPSQPNYGPPPPIPSPWRG